MYVRGPESSGGTLEHISFALAMIPVAEAASTVVCLSNWGASEVVEVLRNKSVACGSRLEGSPAVDMYLCKHELPVCELFLQEMRSSQV